MRKTSAPASRPNKSAPFAPARLTRRRTLAGLQQGELAAKVGVSFQHISKLELGRVGVSVELLHRLASALECEVSDLMPDEQATP